MAPHGGAFSSASPSSRVAPGSAARISPTDSPSSLGRLLNILPRERRAEETLHSLALRNERTGNEYVETPLRRPVNVSVKKDFVRGSQRSSRQKKARPSAITKQPSGFIKKTNTPESDVALVDDAECIADRTSIICPECGKCRCESCRTSRSLPSKWICNNKCLCSAETIVDYVTCLCCVKGLFYHCAGENDGNSSCADRPCSCAPHRKCERWTCMAALAVPLPCLLCYWPLQGIVRLVEMCYQKCATDGCRCSGDGKLPRPPLLEPLPASPPLPERHPPDRRK
ncbi:protein sprouty homolog 4-like [Artemia franciscana]|uniref:Protein sprouty n=1 Tax=Artemia franciscana TaxID=6661 RepID=A0AA88IML9_ARTSF|nr:hypothetical protein QYM36_000850 [Artemia franciscana]